jgi:hypothetical protein
MSDDKSKLDPPCPTCGAPAAWEAEAELTDEAILGLRGDVDDLRRQLAAAQADNAALLLLLKEAHNEPVCLPGTRPGQAILDRLAEAQERAEKAERERDEWRNMVAVLCGDGGHYHAQHGTETTARHILSRYYGLRSEADRMRTAIRAFLDWIAAIPRGTGRGAAWYGQIGRLAKAAARGEPT